MTSAARPRLRLLPVLAAALLLLAAAIVAGVLLTRPHPPSPMALPLRHVSDLALPGDGSRFDYASLDPARGLLFIAHLGASEVTEADIHSGRIVRTITGLPAVHGDRVRPRAAPADPALHLWVRAGRGPGRGRHRPYHRRLLRGGRLRRDRPADAPAKGLPPVGGLAVAALVGFAGNELVARYRIRVGPQAQSYGPSAGRHVAVPRKSTAIQAKQ